MHLQDNVTEHDVTEQQGNEIDTDDEVPASDVGSPSSDQSGATQMYTPNSVALNGASHEMMYGPTRITIVSAQSNTATQQAHLRQ